MTLIENNDIWTEALANAAGNPILDGQTEIYGHGDKVIDEWLSDAPNHIKALFYGFLNRVKLSIGTGLSVNYSGASVLTPTGVVNISPGSINVPASSATYVFISKAGVVQQASALPNEGISLGLVSTGASSVSQITDIRHQVLEQVKTLSLPAQSSPYLPGDVKPTFRSTVESGFLMCDGAAYLKTTYPDLFAAIGSQFNQAGDLNTIFRVPDLRGQTLVGSSPSRPTGTKFGAESVSLSVAQMPSHKHGLNQARHTHTFNQQAHTHTVSDPSHGHGVYDPTHAHTISHPTASTDSGSNIPFVTGNTPEYNFSIGTQFASTGIGIHGNFTGISLAQTNINANIEPNTIDITMSENGGNAPVSVLQPSVSCNYLIKT